MTPPKVSVIALTRDRPKEFLALLHALRQQRMRDFEVIVVGAEPKLEDHGPVGDFIDQVTYLQCVEENISLSRNIGIAYARGDYIAFIDDDAAPEPDWLTEVIKPFERETVGAVGGFVRGRNGVDFQWRGAMIDRYGAHAPLTADDLRERDFTDPTGEFFLSTVGVNSAFRRKALIEVGGFDENYHYFLDESDLCIRLMDAGWSTVLAPEAEVHHAYAESRERAANRAPRDLFQVAASRAYFGLTHGDPVWTQRRIDMFQSEQSGRLKKFIQLGRLSRKQAEWIEMRMIDGVREGNARFARGPLRELSRQEEPHRRGPKPLAEFTLARRPRAALVATGVTRRAIYRLAETLATFGCETTVLDFDLSARRLRVNFADGVWRHIGGIFGRDQFGARPSAPRRCVRVKRELERISARRDLDIIIRPKAKKYRIADLPAVDLSAIVKGFVAEPLRPGSANHLVTMLTDAGVDT